MSDDQVITTGVAGARTRLEINDFVKKHKMFSLYIQALDAMSRTPEKDATSFFQVGGIHGAPYVPWPGVSLDPNLPSLKKGYCTHGSVLFPTWHRPYVVLYEQILQKHAMEIAETYTVDKERWKQAAEDLRQPFWDWAKNAVPPPEIISLERVKITRPDGSTVLVDNPFLRYRFRSSVSDFPDNLRHWPTTLRRPTTEGKDAADNVSQMISMLRGDQSNITLQTINLLTRVRTWPAFSNHSANGDDDDSVGSSLEAIHDGIHDQVGGTGHMGDPATAGFDPIFYLHHCQVDRLLSIWSAANPKVWVTESHQGGGTATIPDGAVINKDTGEYMAGLTPFRNTADSWWASANFNGVDTTDLGYSYPDLEGLDLGDSDEVAARIATIVGELYDIYESRKEATAPLQMKRVASNLLRGSGASDSRNCSSNFHEWMARIRVKKYALGTSFSSLIFLGEAPEDPADWHTSPHYVGAHHAFVNGASQHCDNCRAQADLVIEGFVHLNDAIAAHSGLNTFAPERVKSYLETNLHWYVQKVDGTVVPLDQIPSLEVTVVSTELSFGPGAIFASPMACPVFHPDVTRGRRGGVRI
ncbi:photo-regulated tyrosinase [Fomes fomentarius]|nr:photo-regulated tyrosinase [Fomes fomentarius]